MFLEELRKAIQCCLKEDGCEECPLQHEVCDDFFVPMESIPVGLMELIDEVLETFEVH